MRIAVCRPQVPFERGGRRDLRGRPHRRAPQRRGHEADVVTLPFKWYPGARVLSQAFLWRLADLTEADGRAIDMVIATKFPSYCVRHPNKVVWLLHQFRQAYELDRTELGQFSESPPDRALRRQVQRLDRVCLGEARRVFATSQNVADRLTRSTDIAAEVMPHPPQHLEYRCDEYGDFVLSVGRLDRAKRVDLMLEALAADTTLRGVIAGDGPDRGRLQELAAKKGLDGRVTFSGRVSGAELSRSLRALPRRLLRARRRGLRHGAVRGVPRREAGHHDCGRGRTDSRSWTTAAPASSASRDRSPWPKPVPGCGITWTMRAPGDRRVAGSPSS